MQFVRPMPFGEAVRKLGERGAIGSRLSSSEWRDVPVALRERAFFSSRVESVRFLQRARGAIQDFLEGNREEAGIGPGGVPELVLRSGSRAAFVEQMREFALSEGMGPLPGTEGGLQDVTSEQRLGLIFNVQTQQANDYGYYRQGMDADILNAFPAQRFIRVQEVKEPRTWHTQFEGQTFLKTDPVWSRINQDFGVPWGPWGWGCGHDVEDVDRDEAVSLGLMSEETRVAPAVKGFNEGLGASTVGLDADLVGKMKEAFGAYLEVEGTEMKWNPGRRW